MAVILAMWKAEIGGSKVRDHPGQIVCKTPCPKYPEQNGLEVWLKW
jgi:hypothetical protein